MTSLHAQLPLSVMTDADYETALCHLGEQFTAAMQVQGVYPEGEAAKYATDILVSTFGTREDMTISDWIRDAARDACIDASRLVGV